MARPGQQDALIQVIAVGPPNALPARGSNQQVAVASTTNGANTRPEDP
jgi:hypothetical protein